jgi:hypothetical protein
MGVQRALALRPAERIKACSENLSESWARKPPGNAALPHAISH